MMQPYVWSLARWLARKAIKAEWKATGRNPQYAEVSELAAAINAYFTLHKNELLKEAWEHPVAQQYRHQERMKLARKAQRGRSIAPEELRKLA